MRGSTPVHSVSHLARRFFGAVFSRRLSAGELQWVNRHLDPPVMVVWSEQARWDQRHAYAVARRVATDCENSLVVGAALTHDVGKSAAKLGPCGRAIATVVGVAAGRERRSHWRKGFRRKVRDYFDHPAIGAEVLERCASPPELVEWARIHQKQEPKSVLLTPEWVELLIAADDD